jgi:hypothetical protein
VAKIRPLQPRALELSWSKELRGWVNQWRNDVIGNLDDYVMPLSWDPASFDAWLNRATEQSQTELFNLVSNSHMSELAAHVSLFSWRNWRRFVKESPSKIELPAVQPWNEPGIAARASSWIDKSTSMIKTFDSQRNAALRNHVENAVVNGWSKNALKRSLLEKDPNTGLSEIDMLSGTRFSAEARADLIATDQILTLNSDLGHQRLINANVSYYDWAGMLDERERAAHVAQEGETFRNDGQPMTNEDLRRVGKVGQVRRTPTKGEQPGQAVRCRCYRNPNWAGSDYDS